MLNHQKSGVQSPIGKVSTGWRNRLFAPEMKHVLQQAKEFSPSVRNILLKDKTLSEIYEILCKVKQRIRDWKDHFLLAVDCAAIDEHQDDENVLKICILDLLLKEPLLNEQIEWRTYTAEHPNWTIKPDIPTISFMHQNPFAALLLAEPKGLFHRNLLVQYKDGSEHAYVLFRDRVRPTTGRFASTLIEVHKEMRWLREFIGIWSCLAGGVTSCGADGNFNEESKADWINDDLRDLMSGYLRDAYASPESFKCLECVGYCLDQIKNRRGKFGRVFENYPILADMICLPHKEATNSVILPPKASM